MLITTIVDMCIHTHICQDIHFDRRINFLGCFSSSTIVSLELVQVISLTQQETLLREILLLLTFNIETI